MAREIKLQDKILKDLRSYGKYIVTFKIQRTSDNGVPDIFFTSMLTGAVLVELKQEGEKPSKLQEFMIEKLNACGTQAYVCDTWAKWVALKKVLGFETLSLLENNFII